MQFVTLFSLVIAIVLFGVLKILDGRELAALLGGLSGYILGRGSRSERAPPPAGNNPAQNNPALGPNAGPRRQLKQARIRFRKFFRPPSNASPWLPTVWCLELETIHKALTSFYIFF